MLRWTKKARKDCDDVKKTTFTLINKQELSTAINNGWAGNFPPSFALTIFFYPCKGRSTRSRAVDNEKKGGMRWPKGNYSQSEKFNAFFRSEIVFNYGKGCKTSFFSSSFRLSSSSTTKRGNFSLNAFLLHPEFDVIMCFTRNLTQFEPFFWPLAKSKK